MKNRSHLIDDIKWQCWTALRNQNSKSDLAGGGEFVAGQHQRGYLLRPTLTHFRCKLANILIYTFSPDFLAPKVRWHNLFCLQISCLRQHWAKVPPPKRRGIDRSDRRAQCGDQPICHVVSPFFVEVRFVIDDSIIHDAKWKATLRRNGGHIQTSRKQSALVWPCTEEEKQTWWHHCWPGKKLQNNSIIFAEGWKSHKPWGCGADHCSRVRSRWKSVRSAPSQCTFGPPS